MNTVALMPSGAAEKATPWAWLPALATTTPLARSSSVSRASRVNPPRALKDPVRCRFSHFRYTGPPSFSDSTLDRSSGVREIVPCISSRAAATSSGPTGKVVMAAVSHPGTASRRAHYAVSVTTQGANQATRDIVSNGAATQPIPRRRQPARDHFAPADGGHGRRASRQRPRPPVRQGRDQAEPADPDAGR